jgi:hypothetical protein
LISRRPALRPSRKGSELAALCARLPLALAVVGVRAAASPGLALASLTAQLRDMADRLDALAAEDQVSLGVFSGVLSAVKTRSVHDRTVTTLALVFYLMPAFVLGFLLILGLDRGHRGEPGRRHPLRRPRPARPPALRFHLALTGSDVIEQSRWNSGDPYAVVGGCPLLRRSDLGHLGIREHGWGQNAILVAPDGPHRRGHVRPVRRFAASAAQVCPTARRRRAQRIEPDRRTADS